MPRTTPLKEAFNAGEISPRLGARVGFSKYKNALAAALNVIPLPEGGIMRRSGSRHVAELKSSSVKGRLKRFEFSTTQAYMIEMVVSGLRFYRHQARIAVANIGSVVTNGLFTSNITDWDNRSTGAGSIAHDATNGRLSLIPGGTAAADVGWAEQDITVAAGDQAVEHVLKFQVIGAPSDRIELRVGIATLGSTLVADKLYEVGHHAVAFTPGAATVFVQFRNRGNFRNKTVQIDNVSLLDNEPVEVAAPWVEADLYQVEGPQSADVLYLFHATTATYKLQRFGHTSWSVVEVAWEDGPWLAENKTTTTITATAATGLGVTFTASSIVGINDDTGFQTSDIGRLIRLTDDTTVNWGWGVIVGRTSTTVVTVDVRRTVVSIAAETKWRLGAWSVFTGYPSTAAFFEQRLFAAGTTKQPQTFWASQTGDFEIMSPDSPNAGTAVFAGTVEDDDALDYTISADNVNAIFWMSATDDVLALGTAGGEWIPRSVGAVLTPSDVVVRRQTTQACADVAPLAVDNVILFLQRGGRKIREFAFSFERDGYQALDMTRLAQHITKGGIVEMAFAEQPNSLAWAVRNDGNVLSMTYRREEDVVGLARHQLGGAFGTGDAVVESVAVIPGANGAGQVQDSTERDEVWLIVKRTIDGATKRYIEVIEEDFEGPVKETYTTDALWRTAMLDQQKDAYYLDSCITYDSTPTTTITGLTHLEGQTVGVLGDGAIQPDKTVASGSITLATAASVVQVGLRYPHMVKTFKAEAGTAAGTPVGKTKRIGGITFVILDSHTLKFGPSATSLIDADFREVADTMDNPAPFFTGEYFAEFDDDWKTDPRIVIRSDDPVPFTLLAIAPEVDVKELK